LAKRPIQDPKSLGDAQWKFPIHGPNHKKEMFKDVKVRKAISFLIPRQDILKYKLKYTAILSNGMFSPAFSEMYVPGPFDPYDVFSARRLLSEAGYKKKCEWTIRKRRKNI